MTRTWADSFRRVASDPEYALESLRTRVQNNVARHEEGHRGVPGHWGILSGLSQDCLMKMMHFGPGLVKEEVAPLAPLAARTVERFVEAFGGDEQVMHWGLEILGGVVMLQALGFEIPDDVLYLMKPLLVRMPTTRRDEFVDVHWSRALVALVLSERRVWGPIAGLLHDDDVPFTPGQRFQFNMQGLVANLAGAVVHGASFADVEPAWRDYLDSFPVLQGTKMASWDQLLWMARVVHHEVGGAPMKDVARLVYEDVVTAAGDAPR